MLIPPRRMSPFVLPALPAPRQRGAERRPARCRGPAAPRHAACTSPAVGEHPPHNHPISTPHPPHTHPISIPHPPCVHPTSIPHPPRIHPISSCSSCPGALAGIKHHNASRSPSCPHQDKSPLSLQIPVNKPQKLLLSDRTGHICCWTNPLPKAVSSIHVPVRYFLSSIKADILNPRNKDSLRKSRKIAVRLVNNKKK